MDINQLLDVLKLVATIVAGGLAVYYKFSTKARTKSKELQSVIASLLAEASFYIRLAQENTAKFMEDAEGNYRDATTANGAKFQYVVDKLHGLVPDAFKMIITREMIQDIVQSTFDEMKKFSVAKLDELVDKVPVPEVPTHEDKKVSK